MCFLLFLCLFCFFFFFFNDTATTEIYTLSLHDALPICPPYWGLRDYGLPPSTWSDGWVGCFGLEPTPEMYTAHAVEVFSLVRRVLADDGTLWLNLGDSYATGAGKVGECPGGGAQGARWVGDTRGYRGDRLANGRRDHPAILRRKTRAHPAGSHAGQHTGMPA